MGQLTILAAEKNIPEGMIFIEESLKEFKLDSKKVIKTLLLCEELLVQMINNSSGEENPVLISVKKKRRGASVKISCKGNRFSLDETHTADKLIDLDGIEAEQASVISSMILNAYSGNISLKYHLGINNAYIDLSETGGSDNKVIPLMILGVLCGLALRLVLPETVAVFISDNFFSVVQTLFMNAIKMIVAPLVFFSIADSVTGFSDYGTFGRIGIKVIGFYFFTTFVAIIVAYGLFCIIKPGDPSLAPMVLGVIGNASEQPVAELSIANTIINIVPSNLIAAFVNADMLQIIFVGIFVGIVSGLLGNSSERVQTFIKDGNALTSKMTSLISKTIPYAIFCIMGSLAITLDLTSILALLKVFVASMLGLVCMVVFYMILILTVGRLNPVTFFKKYKDAIIVAFTTASSNVSIPTSMACLEKMGVSKKVYGFSVPLGATINMDGASIQYIITTLFMMRIFNIPTSPGQLLTLFLSVMLLSVGTPGIPGAGIACTAMLFAQVGVIPEAVGFIVAVDTLADFAITASNVIGDAVVTTVVASSEKLLDKAKFNARV